MANLDVVLAEVNDFGKYQRVKYLLIFLACLVPPMATYIHVFIAAKPEYKCQASVPTVFRAANGTTNSADLVQQSGGRMPREANTCSYVQNDTTYECQQFVFDRTYYMSTLTEEWSMVCGYTFLRSNVQSVYFVGYLMGSFVLGNLADKFGRRPIMAVSFILIILGAIGSAFGPQQSIGFLASYIIYALSRFLIAFGTRGINETGYILALELVGNKKRTLAGIGLEHAFSMGQLILVLAAYFIRDWRTLAIVFIIPVIPFLSYVFILPESPRWLISKNREEEALTILKDIARTNKRTLSKELWAEFLLETHRKPKNKETFLTLFKSLIKYPSQSVLILTMFFNWIVNNFIFYGVGLKSNDLGVNPYLSFSISASVEMVAYSFTYFLLKNFGRKKPYFMFLTVGGFACLSIVFLENLHLVVVMAMIGKFSVSASYATLRLYSNEVFPTSIRSSCIGICSTVSRVGVIVAPIINALGDTLWPPLPFLIFGLSGLLAALSTVLLPETFNRALPESISDLQIVNLFNDSRRQKASIDEGKLQLAANVLHVDETQQLKSPDGIIA